MMKVRTRNCCSATHHDHATETPAKSPDAQIVRATAALTKHLAVSIHICGGCNIPASNFQRAGSFGTSSAHQIARVSDTNRAQVAPTARSRTRTAEDATASTASQPCRTVRQRAAQRRPTPRSEQAACISGPANEPESACRRERHPPANKAEGGRGEPKRHLTRTGQDSWFGHGQAFSQSFNQRRRCRDGASQLRGSPHTA